MSYSDYLFNGKRHELTLSDKINGGSKSTLKKKQAAKIRELYKKLKKEGVTKSEIGDLLYLLSSPSGTSLLLARLITAMLFTPKEYPDNELNAELKEMERCLYLLIKYKKAVFKSRSATHEEAMILQQQLFDKDIEIKDLEKEITKLRKEIIELKKGVITCVKSEKT